MAPATLLLSLAPAPSTSLSCASARLYSSQCGPESTPFDAFRGSSFFSLRVLNSKLPRCGRAELHTRRIFCGERSPRWSSARCNERRIGGGGVSDVCADFEPRRSSMGIEETTSFSFSRGKEEVSSSPTSSNGVVGRRWSSFVAEAVAMAEKLSSAAALWVTSAAVVVVVMMSAPEASNALVMTPRKLQGDELATVQLFQENTPSVVYITNLAVRRDVFTLDVMSVPQGSGSGFIWDQKGHVVTNYHVIRGASDLRVTLGDQSVYEADVVGYDEDKDVAVLHIDAPEDKLRPLPVGSSSDLLVGQKVFAIGNPNGQMFYASRWELERMKESKLCAIIVPTSPVMDINGAIAVFSAPGARNSTRPFGLDHTLTTGVISGLRREISSAATGRPIQDVIQTDAAINPGNSGGPLLDSAGNLIGINTAIYSPSGASSGVGFSIPVDTVSGIVDQIVKFGKVTRPVLGISFAPEQSVEQLGVSGVLVLDAPPTGPAGKAGLRPTTRDSYGRLVLGDVITSLNGKKVANGSDLYKILDRCKVGDTVSVEVLRGDKKVTVDVTLEPRD